MAIKPSEISALIKEQVRNYEHKIESDDVGSVVTVGDGIALVYGLDKAMAGELLEFPGGIYGMVLNLEEEHVGAILMGSDANIKEGDQVKRTGKVVEVPVGDELLGRVVNALGQPIDGGKPINAKKYSPIEKIAPGVITGKSGSVSLQTGIKAINSTTPIRLGH